MVLVGFRDGDNLLGVRMVDFYYRLGFLIQRLVENDDRVGRDFEGKTRVITNLLQDVQV